jgi:hypothetical protein
MNLFLSFLEKNDLGITGSTFVPAKKMLWFSVSHNNQKFKTSFPLSLLSAQTKVLLSY